MSKDYVVYSGLSEGMNGNVKFIMRSDGIESKKVEETTNTKTSKDENKNSKSKSSDTNKSLFERIKDLFN